MPSSEDRYAAAELLTRAVENVFRKLIRFLVGRISLVRLQEMMRYIYVQEAERMFRAQNPGKNVPLTRLALVTGLDTRTITQVRRKLDEGEEHYRQQLLSELTPETAIVEAWNQWINESGDDLRILEYGHSSAGFDRLVKRSISNRGVTPQSIIQRLEATHSIQHDADRKQLELRVTRYSPYLSDDEPNIVNAAFSAISNLIGTIEHNVDVTPEQRMFQRQLWTFRLSPEDRMAFRQSMREVLEAYEDAAKQAIEPWEQPGYGPGQVTAGLGLYYFEESG